MSGAERGALLQEHRDQLALVWLQASSTPCLWRVQPAVLRQQHLHRHLPVQQWDVRCSECVWWLQSGVLHGQRVQHGLHVQRDHLHYRHVRRAGSTLLWGHDLHGRHMQQRLLRHTVQLHEPV